VVTFEQYLVAAAGAHHLMAEAVDARRVVAGAEEQECSQEDRGEKSKSFD
jgi:hypothetical protein